MNPNSPTAELWSDHAEYVRDGGTLSFELWQLDAIECDTELLGAAVAEHESECQWFAMCDHAATNLRTHPVLGLVPVCERHLTWEPGR